MDTNNIKLKLLDPENGKTVELIVNENDYNRARNDMVFAQKLLQHANICDKAVDSLPKNIRNIRPQISDELCESTATSTITPTDTNHDINDIPMNEDVLKQNHTLWNYEEVLSLICSMESHMDSLNHPKKRKYVFEHVANDLLSGGFTISAEACGAKWKSLIRSYKACVDNKGKTGRGPTRFQFFTEMDALLGRKPSCEHTLESSMCSEVTESLEETIDPEKITADDASNKTLKKAPLKYKLYELKMNEYIKRQKRHEERMDLEKKVMLLNKFLDNLS